MNENFSKEQLEQIKLGKKNGLTKEQIAIYSDPNFNPIQMQEIRLGYKNGLSDRQIAVYANHELPERVMEELRLEAEKIVNSRRRDEQIRLGYKHGLKDRELSDKEWYDLMGEQLKQVRLGYEHGLSKKQILSYGNKEFSAKKMRKIRLCYEAGLTEEEIFTSILKNFSEEIELKIPINRSRSLSRESSKKMEVDAFVLIDAESLSIDDDFMQHEPRTDKEKATKELIIEAIKTRVNNFYRPIYDPSLTDNREEICFLPNRVPVDGKDYWWWSSAAERYCPSRNSRLGTKLEYGAFLGILIKKLIEDGRSIEWAWNAVCNDSYELGNYYEDSFEAPVYELTGSRNVCGFYDLANTYKILKYDKKIESFWLAGGSNYAKSYGAPVGKICMKYIPVVKYYGRDYRNYGNFGGSGWIVVS